MLNIKDITKRLCANAEPPEVAEIRRNIENSFSNLEFIDDGHKYYLHNQDGTSEQLPSVSGVCHQFQPFVDWDEIKERYAAKHDTTVEAVTRAWEEKNVTSTNNGTSTHLFGESYMHFFMGHPEKIDPVTKPQYERGYFIPYSEKQNAIVKFYEDLAKVPCIYPVMPEAKVYMGLNDTFNVKQKYAGTFDMLFTYKANDGKWKLLLYDWKTNASLFNEYNQNKSVTLNEPFSDLIDQPLSIYTLQLNAYAACLMQLGYEIADRKIVWLKDDGDYEKISVPNIVDRFVKALE